jgi:hypothetical protein
MAAKKKAVAAAATAKAAKDNPYVQRLIEDDELRENIAQAYESARAAFDRLNNGKSPAKAIFDDKKLQKELKTAAESIKDATTALRDTPQKRKGGGLLRKLLLVTVAGGLAIALSEDLRKKVLDALFGAEEEFEYTSTTTASGGATGGATTAAAAGASG